MIKIKKISAKVWSVSLKGRAIYTCEYEPTLEQAKATLIEAGYKVG